MIGLKKGWGWNGKKGKKRKKMTKWNKRKYSYINHLLSPERRNHLLPSTFAHTQAITDVSSIFAQSLYISFILSTKKVYTFWGRTDRQTDRRTDRHDVTLEATPSKFFDGGLINSRYPVSKNTIRVTRKRIFNARAHPSVSVTKAYRDSVLSLLKFTAWKRSATGTSKPTTPIV